MSRPIPVIEIWGILTRYIRIPWKLSDNNRMTGFSHPKSLIIGIYLSNSIREYSPRIPILPSVISIMRNKKTSFFDKGIPSGFVLTYDIIKTSRLIGGYDDSFIIIEIYIRQRIRIHRIVCDPKIIEFLYIGIGIPWKIILNEKDFIIIQSNIRGIHFWDEILNPRCSSRALGFDIHILFFLGFYGLIVCWGANGRWYIVCRFFCRNRWQRSEKTNTYKKYHHRCDRHSGSPSKKRVNHKEDIKSSTNQYTTNY